jgi:hypothetical protein
MRLVDKPGCNDTERIGTQQGDAARIYSCFWTTLPVAAMANFIDPRNWPTYGSLYWDRMAPVAPLTIIPAADGGAPGYAGLFDETVQLPIIGRVDVRLAVELKRGRNFVRVDYDIAPGATSQEVSVDRGFLVATSDNIGPEGEPTFVEGSKVIRFHKEVLNTLPGLACDGGWVYLMINMALNGAGTLPPEGVELVSPSAPGVVSPVAVGVGREIDAWIGQAGQSMAQHGDALKSAVARVTGPRHDPRWVNDLLSMGRSYLGTTGATLQAWRRILGELEKMGGP